MFVAKVIGEVVSTVKHPVLVGYKILLVEKLSTDRTETGETILALDTVDSGVDDTVLVLDEGNSARQVMNVPDAPVRTMIVGVIDHIYV
jgi:ethanolamine utilization protein EutN